MEAMGKGHSRLGAPPRNVTLAENCNERAGSWLAMPADLYVSELSLLEQFRRAAQIADGAAHGAGGGSSLTSLTV